MKIVILGHENPDVDSLLSGYLLEKYMNDRYDNTFEYVIPDKVLDEESLEILNKIGIDVSKFRGNKLNQDDKLFLVDHNVENRFNNEVIGVIDHHPVVEGQENYKKPDFYLNQNACSTTAIIAQMFDIKDKDDFIVALVGALVDTASFNSTKTNLQQVDWFKERCLELGVDFDKYYDIGLCLTGIDDLNEVYLNGLKKYNIEGNSVESSYIQIKGVEQKSLQISQLTELIEEYRVANNIDYFVFIVHDMDKFQTTTYTLSNDGISMKHYDKYTSRGNVIIPELKEYLLNKRTKSV